MTDSTKTIYQSRPKAESILFSPLHCSGDSQNPKNNQNNQKRTQFANTKYEIRYTREFMQNEPNFTLTAHMPNSPNGPRVTGHESRINMQNEPNFTTPPLIFCVTNLLTYCVTNVLSYSFIQNEPNSTTQYDIRNTIYEVIYAKRTQFQPSRYQRPEKSDEKYTKKTQNIVRYMLQKLQKMQRNAKKRALFAPFFAPVCAFRLACPTQTAHLHPMQTQFNHAIRHTQYDIRENLCKTNPISLRRH